MLEERGEGWVPLVYEELYFPEPAQSAGQLTAIWDLLEVEPLETSAIERYLRPSASKLNSPETYARVPNIHVINDRLGSDENGWLFAHGDGAT